MSDFLQLYFNAGVWAEQTKGLRRRQFNAVGHQHIASIDEGLYDKLIVCQSTAGGPQASRGNSFVYDPRQKLFSIEPSPVKFVGKVHIVSVGLS
jgi:hypothetical protein